MRKISIYLIINLVLAVSDGSATVTKHEILNNLKNPNRMERLNFVRYKLSREFDSIQNSQLFADTEIKNAFMQLLKQEEALREKYTSEKIKEGKTPDQAYGTFRDQYPGYVSYLQSLMQLIFLYKDSQTLPVLLDTDVYYGQVDCVYISFGKKIFPELISLVKTGTKQQKQEAQKVLLTWMWGTFKPTEINATDSSLGGEGRCDFSPNLRLTKDEINQIKQPFIESLDEKKIARTNITPVVQGLAEIIKAETDTKEKHRLKSVFRKLLKHENGHIRAEVAGIYGVFGEEEDLKDLEGLAENDGYQDPFVAQRIKDGSWPEIVKVLPLYTVRKEAKDAIKKIRERLKMGQNVDSLLKPTTTQ